MAIFTSFGLCGRNNARPMLRATAYLLLIFMSLNSPVHAGGLGDELYQKGLAERGAWEQWFNSLQGDFKIGAFYWAGQRSLPHPGSCRQMDNDFFEGCIAAKERLAASDAMRQTEPQYKLGWNAWTPTPSQPASPASVTTEAPAATAPTVTTEAPAPATTAPAASTATPPIPAATTVSPTRAPQPAMSMPVTAAPAVVVTTPPPPSADNSEEQFIAQIDKAAAAYNSAPNAMAQGAVRAFRARALCREFPDGEVHDWTGTVERLSSTNDGKGVLSIRISPHITVSTINNSFSESLAPQKTLIAVGSPLWSSVVGLAEGQHVVFSGRFSGGADCFDEISLTVGGGMTDPEFIMKFFSVGPETHQ